uniref:Membrane protein of putative ABC transporter n=1 Tax=Streptomyces roseofulvus TaxID=33902 RepID=O68908_9ACTN|nr:membrane protein of putative ABC transporter [Streptomyces roseofulvus]
MTARYLARRLGRVVLVVWAAYTLSFAVLYLLPGDPVQTMLSGAAGGDGAAVDPHEAQRLRHTLGLDRPLAVQYTSMLGHALRGDLGTSIRSGAPVRGQLAQALPDTLSVALPALVLSVLVALCLALLGAWPRRRALRRAATALPSLGTAMPSFWLGLLLAQWVSFRWGLLPATGGGRSPRATLLAALTLALPIGCVLAQVLGRGLRAALAEPYADVARSRGAGRARLLLARALRNASVAALALLGVVCGQLLAGAVLVETVFARGGIGRLAMDAVTYQDLPVVQGVVVLAALVAALVNLVVDLLLPLLEPRTASEAADAVPAH